MFIESNKYYWDYLFYLNRSLFISKDNKTAWIYGNSIKSSLTIFAGSLQSNRTYQFMVQMENRRNSSIQATGYLLVQIDNNYHQMVAVV